MIFNDNKGQILKNIGGHLLNSFSQQGLSQQSINRKDKENYIEIKKVVEGQSYNYSDYQSRTLKTFSNFKKMNVNKTLMQNCESNNEYFTKMSVKQLSKSKENLAQNQYSNTHNFRSKSTSPQLISQHQQKSDIQFIKNYDDQRIKNIAEDLKSKIQSNLNNKLKHHFIQYSKQIQNKPLSNQDLLANDQNQVYFHNSCLSLKEFFHQKSIELKQKFLEQQSQLIEEKLQIISNKARTIETTKKSLSRSYDITMHTPKKLIKTFNRESKSKLRIDNDSHKTELLKSLNLIQQQNYSINDNYEENQTQIQIENSLEDNQYFSQNKKFDEQHFNEMKTQNLSKNQICMNSPKSLYYNEQSQNKLIPNDVKNSPLVLSNKVNRYMNLIQSFKSFHINQTQLKQDIEMFDSIQVNDLNHISEFSIFKDEKQNNFQNLGLPSEIEQQRSLLNIKTNNEFLIESDQFNSQYIQNDLKQDHFNDGNKFEYKSSPTTKKFILQQQKSFQYNQQLNK